MTSWLDCLLRPALAAFASLAILCSPATAQPRVDAPRWTASWAAAPQGLPQPPAVNGPQPAPPPSFYAQTVRERVYPTISGEQARVRFSNRFGSAPLHIAEASIALGTGGSALSPASLQPLLFGGRREITIAPGADAWSDAVPAEVRAGQAMVISFYLDERTPFGTLHRMPAGATWVAPGNMVGDATMPAAAPLDWNHIVTGLDVMSRGPVRVVVAFGDSITEGVNAFGPVLGRYPDRLAERLRDASPGAPVVSVLNAGIAGNRLLSEVVGPSGIDRFARDVLAQSGVTHAVVLLGINDIGFETFVGGPGSAGPLTRSVSAQRLIAGLQRVVDMARARGVKVLLGTLLPVKGSGYWSEQNEDIRQAVNRWVRDQQVAAVVDFDAALRDPRDPQALNPVYDSGDHLHPGDAGNAAMAAAIPSRELLQ
ncbi:GDSL-type esterase/lipase family protein [Variovorax sp. dw_308]|uniref:GDSL-type esterase/lipase family protein n=1 Tax=Variovorax sp. dw_308 TaxID=2721546 RepID=UPI001C43E5FC|nr:GDSL-type esterase/lipase family protein [Variovorax sp. dw_308]